MHLQHSPQKEGSRTHKLSLPYQAAHLQLPAGILKQPAARLAFAEALASSGSTSRALEVLQAALEGGPAGEVSINATQVLVVLCPSHIAARCRRPCIALCAAHRVTSIALHLTVSAAMTIVWASELITGDHDRGQAVLALQEHAAVVHAIGRLHLATDPDAQAAAKPDGLHQALSALHKQMPALLAAKPPAAAVEPLMHSILAAALAHEGRQGWDSVAGEAPSMCISHAGCTSLGGEGLLCTAV